MESERPLWVPTRFYIPGQDQSDLDITLPFGGPMFRKGDRFSWMNEQREELQGEWEVREVRWELGDSGQWCQLLILGRAK